MYKRFKDGYMPKTTCHIAAETAALLSAGISAAGSAGGVAFNAASSKKQREWSEKMQNQQNAWNLEMWNKANEYNSPSAQVERLRDAGLNPLYYGLDGSSANALESAQPLGYERANISALDNPIGAGLDAAAKVAQISNIQADTAKKNEETLTETQRREKIQADIEEVRQSIKNKMADEKLTDTQRERLQKDINWLDRLNEATLAAKQADAALTNAQKNRIEELLEGEKIIQAKTIEDFEHKWAKIAAEISKIAAENKILAKDFENYALNHANNGFMGTGLSLPNIIRGVKSANPKSGEENKFGEGTDWQSIAQSGQ